MPCLNCTIDECTKFKDACGDVRPWVCTAGAAAGGCADEEDYWLAAGVSGM